VIQGGFFPGERFLGIPVRPFRDVSERLCQECPLLWALLDIYSEYRRVKSKGGLMGEHIMHKKESKKAPQKTLKEKRKEKKSKDKGAGANIPSS
jgi:hypothetical protein